MGLETDGAISVRAIVPEDAGAYRGILQRTSPQDRYCRFFHVIDHLDDEAIERSVEARADAIGLIAERHGRAIGVAHAFFIDRGAEIAMIVASDGRRQGAGRLLFERLIAVLQQRNCMCVVAYSLAQNGPLSKLARSVGMRPGAPDGGIVTWTLAPKGYVPAESSTKAQGDVDTAGSGILHQEPSAAPIVGISSSSLQVCNRRSDPPRTIGISLLVYRGLLIFVHAGLTTTLVLWRPAVLAAASSLDRIGAIQCRIR